MAIKPPDLLNRLPSVAELLEKPPIRALVERWNRSTVAGSVRTFLDEMRTDFERRTAAIPSIRELAERAARYVVSRQHHSLGIAINATGQIDGPPWSSTPLAETALERMIALGREYTTEPTDATLRSTEELQRALCRLAGAEAAAVVHSYSGAIWLALVALAADREVIVARAHVGDDLLRKLAAAANVTLKEVGDTVRTTSDDFAAAVSARSAAFLRHDSGGRGLTSETNGVEFESLVHLARERDLPLINALGAAPIIDPPASLSSLGRSAAASLATGAKLVILRGDALVGGPACGILLGRRDLIQRIVAHPLFLSCEIDPLRAAAIGATLSCYEAPQLAISPLPVWQCLNTSIENLRNRAERLAAQLAQMEGVESATATETRSAILAARAGEGWPSYGVSLMPKDANVAALEHRLQTARIPIRGRVEGDRIILDLRTVLARQDKLIVDALLGAGATEPASVSGSVDSTVA
jgi:L-seryl-tRNA(Ser) seleniumtransferase